MVLVKDMWKYKIGTGQFHAGMYGVDSAPYSEQVAAKETPQPQSTEPVAAGSASSSVLLTHW